jgi:hypothetical protein
MGTIADDKASAVPGMVVEPDARSASSEFKISGSRVREIRDHGPAGRGGEGGVSIRLPFS